MIKKFILRTFVLIIPVVICLAFCEYSLRTIPNDYSYKCHWLDTHASEVEVLILGSSHAYYGINPRYFSQKTFNAAHVSQSINYDWFIFNKYFNQLSNLKALILPVSYFALRASLENGIEDWRVKNYSIYYGCQYHKYIPKYNLELFDKPILGATFANSLFKYSNHISCDKSGWGTSYTKENRKSNWEEDGKIAAARHSYTDTTLTAENIKFLNNIVQCCAQRNISVILVTTPTWHTYYEHLEKSQLKELICKCEELTREYNNAFYLNLLKDPRFLSDDFFDADHLNEFGAKKLSLILSKTIKRQLECLTNIKEKSCE